MTTRASFAAALFPLLLASLAVAGPGRAQEDCKTFKEVPEGATTFTILVDDEAVPQFDCVAVKPKKTTITWQGTPNAESVLVAFKKPSLCAGADPDKPAPGKPAQKPGKAVLDRKKMNAPGKYCYSIVVIRRDGTVRTVDPKLIINP